MNTQVVKKHFSQMIGLMMASQLLLAPASMAAPMTPQEKIMKIDDIIRALDAHRLRLENLESHPNALSELRANLEGESLYETNDYSSSRLKEIIADTKKKVLRNPKNRVYRARAIIGGAIAFTALGLVMSQNSSVKMREVGAYSIPIAVGLIVAGFTLDPEDLSFESARKAVLKELADRRSDFLTLRQYIVWEIEAQQKAARKLGEAIETDPNH